MSVRDWGQIQQQTGENRCRWGEWKIFCEREPPLRIR
jgi:hypothetical protein